MFHFTTWCRKLQVIAKTETADELHCVYEHTTAAVRQWLNSTDARCSQQLQPSSVAWGRQRRGVAERTTMIDSRPRAQLHYSLQSYLTDETSHRCTETHNRRRPRHDTKNSTDRLPGRNSNVGRYAIAHFLLHETQWWVHTSLVSAKKNKEYCDAFPLRSYAIYM